MKRNMEVALIRMKYLMPPFARGFKLFVSDVDHFLAFTTALSRHFDLFCWFGTC
jgi:hypothetical protein